MVRTGSTSSKNCLCWNKKYKREKFEYWSKNKNNFSIKRLQANILKVDKINLTEDNQGGFSDAVLAGGVGAFLGGQRSGGVYTAVGWGLAASAVATVADALVKDVKYAMVTDILITEKTEKTVNVATKNSVKQGSSGSRTSTSTEQTNMDKYSTRVLSIANKVNLDFNEAVPALEDELGRVVGGIF